MCIILKLNYLARSAKVAERAIYFLLLYFNLFSIITHFSNFLGVLQYPTDQYLTTVSRLTNFVKICSYFSGITGKIADDRILF